MKLYVLGGDWNMTGTLFPFSWEINDHPNLRYVEFRGIQTTYQKSLGVLLSDLLGALIVRYWEACQPTNINR